MTMRMSALCGLEIHLAVLRGLYEKDDLSPTLAQDLEDARKNLDLALGALAALGTNLAGLKCGLDAILTQSQDGLARPGSPTLALIAACFGPAADELRFVGHIGAQEHGHGQGQEPRQEPRTETPHATIQAPQAQGQTKDEVNMQGLNDVHLIGRLGQDPILKFGVNSGTPYCHMNLACEERYKDKDGQLQTHVEWVPVICFGKTAENCDQHLAKGSLVCVKGGVSTSKTQNDEGKDVYTTRIKAKRVLFLGPKPNGDKAARPAAGEDLGNPEDLGPAFPSDASGMDDVPF